MNLSAVMAVNTPSFEVAEISIKVSLPSTVRTQSPTLSSPAVTSILSHLGMKWSGVMSTVLPDSVVRVRNAAGSELFACGRVSTGLKKKLPFPSLVLMTSPRLSSEKRFEDPDSSNKVPSPWKQDPPPEQQPLALTCVVSAEISAV
eukprot:CAMPEP_0171645348 /NCGR_PEP_ID=MMETSP0990-20121206/34015_1 /TAXON_ID=483369 /ORGANISM="non described non described, Strain CCMP2098" /LENGTH=145 /DNA_ID=CAMNT_0012221779 /DNA_START=394 /DNA_END=831 /DNA_ORIENTATION=+